MHSITRATGEGAEKLSKFRQCYYRMVAGSNLAHCFKAKCPCVHYFPRFTIYTHYKGALFKVESYLDGTERAYQIGISMFGIEMW